MMKLKTNRGHLGGGVYKSYFISFVSATAMFMVAFLLSAVVASVLAPVSDSSAQTVKVDYRDTGYYVSVTSADNVNLSVDATPVGQIAVSDATTVNVKTNAPLGYKLYLSTNNDELTSTDSGITQTFKPVTSDALTVNTWGFSKTGESKTWNAVPEVTSGNESSGYLLASKDTPNLPNGDDINVYYGINATTTMPAGTYTTTVTYTAIGDGIPEEHTMQEFTLEECNEMPVDQTFYMVDSRNNKIYSAVHAKDGNCWMTQNLSIYNQKISSADSDLPDGTSITLPASSDWNTNNYTDLLLHVATNSGYEGEVYYSWKTATGGSTASSGTAGQSICPKDWSLPVVGDASTDKTYSKLMDAYSVTKGSQLLDSSDPAYILGFHDYYGMWDYSSASERFQGTSGSFWSADAAESNAYSFTYTSSGVTSLGGTHIKSFGLSVRCVFDPYVEPSYDSTTMQGFSATDCANMTTGTTTLLTDVRNDKEYNIVKAKDGNCWMADNLAIYSPSSTELLTISGEDSDLPNGTSIALPYSTNYGRDDEPFKNRFIHVATNSGYEGEVYYNWCTAVAATDCTITETPSQSICPKNWGLPIDGNELTDKSFRRLMYVYSINKGSDLVDSSNPAYVLGFKNSGYWEWAVPYESGQGSDCRFWTATTYGASQSYQFIAAKTRMWYDYINRPYGFSIRCVLR